MTIKRSLARALTGSFALFALAACGTTPPPAAEAETPPVTAAPPPAPEITVKPLLPSPPSPPSPPPAVAPVAKPKRQQTVALPPKPKPESVDDNPRQLFGLSGQRVAALLGPANFVRRDGTAEVWQYRAAECVLDVFLYRRDRALSVAYVDLRQRQASNEAPRRCFARLLSAQR